MKKKGAKWFRSATMMAFLAVVALFVSPVLALGCCCGGMESHLSSALVSSSLESGTLHGCCADDVEDNHSTLAAKPAHAASHQEQCAVMQNVCGCQDSLIDQAFTAPDSHSFVFSPATAALPAHTFSFALAADVRCIGYACYSARPRGPDQTTAAGRAPPVLALS